MYRNIDYKQIGALAALGLGTMALRKRTQKSYGDDKLFANTTQLKFHPNLARLLYKMQTLQEPRLTQKLVVLGDNILIVSHYLHSNAGTPNLNKYTVQLNRFVTAADSLVEEIISAAKKNRDPQVGIACVDYVQEELPALTSIFESILHNAMLDAQT